MKEEIITAIPSLLGAFVGGFVVFLSTYVLWKIQKDEEKKAITSAMLTEIAATLELIKARDYVAEMRRILAQIESGQIPGSNFEVIVPDDHSLIYKQNASKIGLLPDHVRDRVVLFHQILEGIICDVKPGGHIARDNVGKEEFEELIDMCERLITIGNELKSQSGSDGGHVC